MFGNIPVILLLLISNIVVKKLCIISILLNCWDRFIYLLPRIWSSLVYVLRTLEKQVYSQLLGAAFYTYQLDLTDVIEFFYIIFIFSVSIICWERVLKSPSIIVNLDISPFNFITFYSHILQFLCLVHSHLGIIFFLDGITPVFISSR